MKNIDVKEALLGLADKTIAHKDGTFTARRTYFYRHGRTADSFAQDLLLAVPNALVLSCEEKFNPWPRDSYFEVKFRITEKS